MNCRKARSSLSAYTKNELSHSVKERLVQHLDNCPACKKASIVAEQVDQTIRHLPKAELSDDFNMKLFERIHNAPRGERYQSAHMPKKAPSGFMFRIKYAAPVLATVALLLVVTSFVSTTEQGNPVNHPGYASSDIRAPRAVSDPRGEVPSTRVGLRGLQLEQRMLDSLSDLVLTGSSMKFQRLGEQKKQSFGDFGQRPYVRNVGSNSGMNRHYVLPNVSTNRKLVNDAAY